MNIPRGTRYELCRSVHAEQNAIISAARKDMIGGTMYISGFEVDTGEIVAHVDSCAMCKRAVINSGVEKVVFADPSYDKGRRVIMVHDWVSDDETLTNKQGY